MSDPASVALVALLAAAALILGGVSALLERSGPIRLRSWAEEAGEELRELYGQPPRFQGFRLIISLLAQTALVGFVLAVARHAVSARTERPFAVALVAGVVLVVGAEAVNRASLRRSDVALRLMTPLARFLRRLSLPLLALLTPVVGRRLATPVTDDTDDATREEIEAFIDFGRREGILEGEEGELVRGLVDFADTRVRSVMTPRVDIACAALDTPTDELVDLVLKTGHSRLPLYRESIDEIAGILHVRDLLRVVAGGEDQLISSYLQPAHFVPETKALGRLLRELQDRHQEIAIVVDEYGGTEGLVTMEDLLEEIFGEIVDEHDKDAPEPIRLADGSWRVDGRFDVGALEQLFPGMQVADEEFETIGGLVFGVLGRVPRVGDSAVVLGLRLLVESADGRRALRVRVSRQDEESEEAVGE